MPTSGPSDVAIYKPALVSDYVRHLQWTDRGAFE
jgi:hypothetical protein